MGVLSNDVRLEKLYHPNPQRMANGRRVRDRVTALRRGRM